MWKCCLNVVWFLFRKVLFLEMEMFFLMNGVEDFLMIVGVVVKMGEVEKLKMKLSRVG